MLEKKESDLNFLSNKCDEETKRKNKLPYNYFYPPSVCV
jgi:hypothetical protein